MTVLKELAAHLREHDEPTWVDGLAECRFLIEDGDKRGLPRLLGQLGGDGGLRDLDLRLPNRDSADPAVRAANERLQSLLDDARKLVEALA